MLRLWLGLQHAVIRSPLDGEPVLHECWNEVSELSVFLVGLGNRCDNLDGFFVEGGDTLRVGSLESSEPVSNSLLDSINSS